MDQNPSVNDDIESCRIRTMNEEQEELSSSAPVSCVGLVQFDVPVQGKTLDDFAGNVQVVIDTLDNKVEPVVENKKKTDHSERRKSSGSAKKPPKPPRPPRGMSLDAADQKLMRELHEIAMLKRARIERMKALKKMKAAAKAPSTSSNGGSLFAMLCTALFCIVIICQG
ncbi:OLC1v1020707C2 [Oldenlandia corymbosa var. corymbosa]|nr:OLC1v1020707C2 [Oldenlandia corymbosa var. corymbosa]